MTRAIALTTLALLAGSGIGEARDQTTVAHWGFDLVEDRTTLDTVTGASDSVSGHFRLVPGVKDRALTSGV